MALINQTQQEYYSNEDFGNYQFTSLQDIINQFIVAYVGENKLISKIKRIDVAYHAQRALQELSFDVFKSCKSIETEVQPNLTMPLPQDYVNYTKISSVDSSGIKHILYPTLSKTSNPKKYQTDDDNEYLFNTNGGFIPSGELTRNGSFHGETGINWSLNQVYTGSGLSNNPGSPTQPVSVSTVSTTLGDPEQGWFFQGNKIKGYNLVQGQGFTQRDVEIISGESYKASITISGYTGGLYRFSIVDEKGDITHMSNISANGTYTETLVAGETANGFFSKVIMFKQVESASGRV